LIGWPAIAGSTTSPYGAVICGRDGVVLKARRDIIRSIMTQVPSMSRALHSFVNVINVQMGETIGAPLPRTASTCGWPAEFCSA